MTENVNSLPVDQLPKPDLLQDFPLPAAMEYELPASDKPYIGLKPFKREDAKLFFGRSKEIHRLCRKVLLEPQTRLILFDGYSGTGKSSLLQAGLIPRIEAAGWQVKYGRREEDTIKGLPGLLKTLAAQIQAKDHQALIIIDQLEEAITNPIRDEKGELDNFFKLLKDQLKKTSHKFILAFRSEYIRRIQSKMGDLDAPDPITLQQLSLDGALEAIRGVCDKGSLRSRYKISFSDTNLPLRIAKQLYKDGDNY